jgi:hypothetical protein
MKTCVFKTNGHDYTATVSHNMVTGMHNIILRQKIEGTSYDSKFEMFLENSEFDKFVEFLNTINGNMRSDLK